MKASVVLGLVLCAVGGDAARRGAKKLTSDEYEEKFGKKEDWEDKHWDAYCKDYPADIDCTPPESERGGEEEVVEAAAPNWSKNAKGKKAPRPKPAAASEAQEFTLSKEELARLNDGPAASNVETFQLDPEKLRQLQRESAQGDDPDAPQPEEPSVMPWLSWLLTEVGLYLTVLTPFIPFVYIKFFKKKKRRGLGGGLGAGASVEEARALLEAKRKKAFSSKPMSDRQRAQKLLDTEKGMKAEYKAEQMQNKIDAALYGDGSKSVTISDSDKAAARGQSRSSKGAAPLKKLTAKARKAQ